MYLQAYGEAKMNKQIEDKILEMLLHIHEKSTGAHPLDPQKDVVEWWIKRSGGSRIGSPNSKGVSKACAWGLFGGNIV